MERLLFLSFLLLVEVGSIITVCSGYLSPVEFKEQSLVFEQLFCCFTHFSLSAAVILLFWKIQHLTELLNFMKQEGLTRLKLSVLLTLVQLLA